MQFPNTKKVLLEMFLHSSRDWFKGGATEANLQRAATNNSSTAKCVPVLKQINQI